MKVIWNESGEETKGFFSNKNVFQYITHFPLQNLCPKTTFLVSKWLQCVICNQKKKMTKAVTGSVLWKKVLLKISQACNLIKRLQHRCFPVNFAKFLRTPIMQNICKQLLLKWKTHRWVGIIQVPLFFPKQASCKIRSGFQRSYTLWNFGFSVLVEITKGWY